MISQSVVKETSEEKETKPVFDFNCFLAFYVFNVFFVSLEARSFAKLFCCFFSCVSFFEAIRNTARVNSISLEHVGKLLLMFGLKLRALSHVTICFVFQHIFFLSFNFCGW